MKDDSPKENFRALQIPRTQRGFLSATPLLTYMKFIMEGVVLELIDKERKCPEKHFRAL